MCFVGEVEAESINWFGICEKEEIYENNIIYLYISPFIEIYKIIINFLEQNILKLR